MFTIRPAQRLRRWWCGGGGDGFGGSIVQRVRIFSENTSMQFGMNEYAVLIMKTGRKIKFDVIMIAWDDINILLRGNERYKYTGVLQDDKIMEKVRRMSENEYKWRIRKLQRKRRVLAIQKCTMYVNFT